MDVIKSINRLKAVDFSEEQAAAIVEAFVEHEKEEEAFATKKDLEVLQKNIKTYIDTKTLLSKKDMKTSMQRLQINLGVAFAAIASIIVGVLQLIKM